MLFNLDTVEGVSRARGRTVLYMDALVASRRNAVIRELYPRLLADGKSKKVAFTACHAQAPGHIQRDGQERAELESRYLRLLTSKAVALV